jgi:hypothetical protein
MQTCLSRRPTLVFLMLSLVAAVWAEQTRPDFSGTWSQIEPELGPGATHVERIDLHGSTLKIDVEAQVSGGVGGGMVNLKHTYTVGGPAETSKDRDGHNRSVIVAWDGPVLVFIRATQEGANTTTEREVWSMSEDGKMLVKSRDTTSWKGTQRSRTVLEQR